VADYRTVARLDQIPGPEGGGLRVVVEGRKIALFRAEGGVYAVDDTCTHAEASLSEGRVAGHAVQCPLHGARFDLRTGRPLSPPAFKPVRTYPVRVEGDQVQVRI
jgi:3-phenylpropionate/trans-cinnamate dioxygenase ferredoxin subunit